MGALRCEKKGGVTHAVQQVLEGLLVSRFLQTAGSKTSESTSLKKSA